MSAFLKVLVFLISNWKDISQIVLSLLDLLKEHPKADVPEVKKYHLTLIKGYLANRPRP